MAFAGFTRTLPDPTATLTGFVCLLNEDWFTQADANALDGTTFINGGGSLRIYSDSAKTTQYPVQVVEFVTGGTPIAQVWVRIPTYASADDVWIESDATATTQPAVTDVYGRNAAWVDYEAVLHMNETGTDGVFLDSTGNGHDTTLTTGATLATSATSPFGGSWPDFTTAEAMTLTGSDTMLNNSAISISSWVNSDVSYTGDGLVGNRYNTFSDQNWAQQQAGTRFFVKGSSTEDVTLGGSYSVGSNHYIVGTHNDTSLDQYLDGTLAESDTSIANTTGIISATGQDYRVGTYYDDISSRRYDGRVGEVRLSRFKSSSDLVTSEYNNQSSPGTFGTSSGWTTITGTSSDLTTTITDEASIVAGGSTITLTLTGDTFVAAGATFDAERQGLIDNLVSAQSEANGWNAEKVNLPVTDVVRTSDTVVTITLSALASYDITADEEITSTIQASALVTSASDVVSTPTFTISAIPTINVIGITTDCNYLSIQGQVDLTGEVLVSGTLSSYNYYTITGLIDLTREIAVIGNTYNYQYTSINGITDVTGELSVTGSLVNYLYSQNIGSIDLTGEILVSGNNYNYIYQKQNGIVSLDAEISVFGATSNYIYSKESANIGLIGEINITGNNLNYSFSSTNGIVNIGQSQLIGDFTVKYKESGILLKYKIDEISLGFKSSDIKVQYK